MTKKSIIIIAVWTLSSISALAQQHIYSLQQSKEFALQNNFAVKNGQLGVSSSQENKLAARSAYLPSLSATAIYAHGFNDILSPTPGIAPNGVSSIFVANAMAQQSVYRGGRVRTNNKLADLQLDVSETRLKQSKDSVLLQTEQKYWQIYNTNEQYKTLLYNEKYLDTLYKEQADNLKAGLIAKNDLLRVKVQRNQVILDKTRRANDYQVAVLDFCRFIGVPYDSLMVLSDTAYVVNNPANLYAKPESVLKNTNNYRLLEKNVSAESLQTRLRRADYLPSLSVGVSAAQLRGIDAGMGRGITPLALGTLSIPISSWLWGDGKHVLKQRQYAEQVAQNNLIDGANQLQQNILRSWLDLNEGYQQVILLRDNLASSAENLKATRDTYRSGLNNLSDLLDARSDYQRVEDQLAEANSNYLIRLSQYKFAIGKYEQP